MYQQLARILQAFSGQNCQNGQTLVEYSLILAVIALGTIAALSGFAVSMDDLYQTVRRAANAMSGV